MFQFPTLPGWDGLHPLIIHFPIALLFTAPLFVVIGAALAPARGRTFMISALILMFLGTASIFLSMETGEVARGVVALNPAIKAAIGEHEKLAEATQVLFSALTVVFAGLLFVPNLVRVELGCRVNVALMAVFLIFYATGILFLVNTAHHGGVLVHELGLRPPMSHGVSASVK